MSILTYNITSSYPIAMYLASYNMYQLSVIIWSIFTHACTVCTYIAIILIHLCISYVYIDFNVLEAHYHSILHLIPDEYELTIGKLQNYISDDQICTILNSSNSTLANKVILDCLVERISCREGLLDLCDQLESITASSDLRIITNELRLG